jgi:hypothetical protein
MDFSNAVSAADEPKLGSDNIVPRRRAATMRIMCGVFGHMGREDFGCNQKINHGLHKVELSDGIS